MRGKDLLTDMLPRRRREKEPPILPIAQTPTRPMTQTGSMQIPPLVETEANERPLPEFDATHTEVREMQSGQVAVGELGHSDTPKPIAELASTPIVRELHAREVAAELKGSYPSPGQIN